MKLKLIFAFSLFTTVAQANPHTTIEDHYETRTVKIPHSVEICTDGNGKSNLNNFLEGAIIGGAIGNNIPGEKGGGALGAIIGGALNAERNKMPTCRTETTFTDRVETVYSHSTITFWSQGKRYKLKFRR